MSGAFRKGSDYPTQSTANVGDLILVFAAGETYTITVQTLIAAIEAAAAEIARREAQGVNKGDPGVSPIIKLSEISGGTRVTITDAEGEKHVDLLNGGAGFSPTVEVTPITGGHRITITDVNGPHPIDLLNGSGAGDMIQANYDAEGTVKAAGGIVAYVESIVGDINTALDEINGEVV